MGDELDALHSGRGEYQHPKVRYWRSMRERHPENDYRLEILRPKQGLMFGPARLYMHVFDQGGQEAQAPDEMMWDGDLDEAFIEHGFRAITPENESIRFALAIRRSLSKPERRYGEGFFNAVLVGWARKSPFAPRLQPILAEIHEGNIPEEGSAFSDCWDQIQAAIECRADDLTERLRWERSDAIRILVGALGGYLDERFNVSNRLALGLGRGS